MKKVFLAAISLMVVLPSVRLSAQMDMSKYGENAEECVKYHTYYTENYKQKNIERFLGIHREVGDIPQIGLSILTPLHALGDGILV